MDKKTYRAAFDAVCAPQNAEDRVARAISPRPRMAARRMALILCAVLVLTCGASLASGVAGQWLDAVVSLNGAEVPAGNFQEIGITAEDAGVRMTLESVAGDGVHTYFLLNVEALEGQDLSNTDPQSIPMEDSLYVHEVMSFSGSGGYGFRPIRLDDGSDPARAQLCLKYDFGTNRWGDKLTLKITGLNRGVYTGADGERCFEHEPVAGGEWSFTFRLSRSLDGVHYAMEEYDFDISVSPLGLAVDGIGCRKLGEEGVLLLKDGSKIELTGYGYSSGSRNHEVYREMASWEFTQLIDPGQAAALILGGREYPLTPAK